MIENFLVEIFGESLYTTILQSNPELLCVFIMLFTFMFLMLIFSVIRSLLTVGGKI